MNAPQHTLSPGFKDVPVQSAWTFRAILEAMARPGQIQSLNPNLNPPEPMYPATAAVALTLIDYDTPVWLDDAIKTPEVIAFLKFHCGCGLTDDPSAASFALVADANVLPPLSAFAAGKPEYPDRSTTLVIQSASLGNRQDIVLTGPGIETTQGLSVPSLSLEFWHQLQDNSARYPLGVDILFTTVHAVAGCPRSVDVKIAEAA